MSRHARIEPGWIPLIDTGRAWKVYTALATFANAERKAWPHLSTLAKMTCLDESNVRKELRALEVRGALLTFHNHPEGKGGSSLYVLQPDIHTYLDEHRTDESGPGGLFGSTIYTTFNCLFQEEGVALQPRTRRNGESCAFIDRLNQYRQEDHPNEPVRKVYTPNVVLDVKPLRALDKDQMEDAAAMAESAISWVASGMLPWSVVAYLAWHVANEPAKSKALAKAV